MLEATVSDAADGVRIDAFLASALDGYSRSRIQALIAAGRVREAERTITEAAYRVKPGQRIRLFPLAPVDPEPVAQAIPLNILFEDRHLVVLNKAAGMVVHPAAGNPDGTLVNALIAHCGDSLSGIGGVRRPGIVHRLDKDTSGVMVAAKTDAAHRRLAGLFAAHDIERVYLALVSGAPGAPRGVIEGAIGRDPHHRKRMAVRAGGKHAVTRYRVLRRFGAAAGLLACTLETGRTHQIRVHLAHIGHPVIGDRLYGRRRTAPKGLAPEAAAAVRDFPRQALHASVLGFDLDGEGERRRFRADPPADMASLMQCLSQ